MPEKFVCRILSLWHEAPFVMSKDNLVASNFTPVAFDGGTGTYTCMGYIAKITDEYISLIIDNSFTLDDGFPVDTSPILSDAIKDVVNKVVSDTFGIAKIELKASKRPVYEEVILDIVDLPDEMPPQLVEIQKWIQRKLITDMDVTVSDDQYDRDYYFADGGAEMSQLTRFVGQWDQFYTLTIQLIDQLTGNVTSIPINDVNREYLHEIMGELDTLSRKLLDFKTFLSAKEHSKAVMDIVTETLPERPVVPMTSVQMDITMDPLAEAKLRGEALAREMEEESIREASEW